MGLSNRSTALAAPDISEIGRFLTRATSEPGVRDEVRVAVQSIKSAYRRFDRAKSPTAALLNDKKLKRDLRRALHAIRGAAIALTAPPRMRTRDAIALGGVLSAVFIVATFVFVRGRKLRSQSAGEQSGTGDEPGLQQPGNGPSGSPPGAPPPPA